MAHSGYIGNCRSLPWEDAGQAKKQGGTATLLRNLNVRWFEFDMSDVLEMRFEDQEAERYQARKGDLIVCEGGYPGRAAIWQQEEPIFLQKALHRVRFNEPERAKWVLYWLHLNDLTGSLSEWFSGTGIQHFTKAALSRFKVPLPPLEEQKRIVAVLDQAFVALDRARANAEANLADSLELRVRAVDDELASEELGALRPLGNHIDLLTGFAFKSRGYTEDPSDIRLIRGDNIVQREFRWEGVKRWPISDRETYQKYELARDDVLIAMDRTWVSAGIKFAIVNDDALPSLLVQRVARLRAKKDILPRYLGYWIGNRIFESYVLGIQTGLGVPHVSGGQISSFPVRVPSLPAQEALIERLDSIVDGTKFLRKEYRRKLADIADLRQSLLQRAFSGQLTA
jgi:type I restriction enzyme S subunit